MASGSIVIANETSATNLYFTVCGDASGYPALCSGVLGNAYPDNEAKCSVSGYDSYLVTVGPFGTSPATDAWLDHIDASKNPRVTFAVDVG